MAHCHCTCHEHHHGEGCTGTDSRREWMRIIASALLLFAGIGLSAADAAFFRNEGLRLAWYLAAYLPMGLPVMKEAWEEIVHGDVFNEFTLMTLATIGAFYIGEYPEGVAVMLFYSLGELFQERAVGRARHSIRALLDVRPETATVIRNTQPVVVNPREVRPGEVIEVKTGERVPLDGTLLNETAAFNTSALTGESLPRTLHEGEDVLAGMIATDKAVRLSVIRPFEDSALSRILAMVQEASERKAPAELFIRKFARIYTPAVTGLAALIVLLPWVWSLMHPVFGYVFADWLYRGLVFLVISCPCALVVSIPLSYFGGIGAASRLGILFKGGNYLDAITKIDTIVFDKTGTLTQGTFEVKSCRCAKDVNEASLLHAVASAEQSSTHPVAKAIVRHARQAGIAPLPTGEVKELAGFGLETTVDGEAILVGNARLHLPRRLARQRRHPHPLCHRRAVCRMSLSGRHAEGRCPASHTRPASLKHSKYPDTFGRQTRDCDYLCPTIGHHASLRQPAAGRQGEAHRATEARPRPTHRLRGRRHQRRPRLGLEPRGHCHGTAGQRCRHRDGGRRVAD